jgi:hypothetical protein
MQGRNGPEVLGDATRLKQRAFRLSHVCSSQSQPQI